MGRQELLESGSRRRRAWFGRDAHVRCDDLRTEDQPYAAVLECPERFGEFLDSDLTTEQIGQKILEERAAAAGPEIDGHHAGPGADGESNIDTAAVYRRWNDASAFATGKSAS